MKQFFTVLITVIVIAGLGWIGFYFYQDSQAIKQAALSLANTTDTDELPKNDNPTYDETSDIIVGYPESGQTISSPLKVTGQARGIWFFENDFPMELKDANGKTISWGISGATENWMTINFVGFIGEIEFENPETKTGILIMHKDNPSGLPENDDSIEIPVVFATDGINDFNTCIDAGFPAMESYPRQCKTDDGRHFVEIIKEESKDGCMATGCSGQICSDQEVTTTCEFKSEYTCYQNSTCERQSDGECGWTQTLELIQCLQDTAEIE